MSNTNLTLAFHEMNLFGLIAEENFQRCFYCASAEVATLAAHRVWEGRVVRGCCFSTEKDDALRRCGQDFYLAYGAVNTFELGWIGLTTQEVGKIICQCLDRFDVRYVWNGDPEVCVRVKTESIRPEGLPLPGFSRN